MRPSRQRLESHPAPSHMLKRLLKPFGIAAWQTTAAVREIRMRSVAAPAGPLKRAAVMAAPIHIAQAFQPRDRDRLGPLR